MLIVATVLAAATGLSALTNRFIVQPALRRKSRLD